MDICLPIALHAEFVLRALQAGKHVLVELPLAAGMEDAKRVAEAAARSDKHVFVDMFERFIHLAAAVSAECEADFDLGMHANLDTTRALLDAARGRHTAGRPAPRVVFSSSLAGYGQHPDQPPNAVVDESTLPSPRSSYGTQKLMCEQLIADCTRRGFVVHFSEGVRQVRIGLTTPCVPWRVRQPS